MADSSAFDRIGDGGRRISHGRSVHRSDERTTWRSARATGRAAGVMSSLVYDRKQLAEGWLALQRMPDEGDVREDLEWVLESTWDLCDDAPHEALEFVAAVLDRDDSEHTMALLSAGPLEALLRRHGPKIIGRVEQRARRDATFMRLLGHVWRTSVSPKIWERIEQVRRWPATRPSAEACVT
jgi:hypothetical protein